MRKYRIPESKQFVSITSQVIRVLNKYIQKGEQPENGGLLFAEFILPEIRIIDVSHPTKKDIKRKYEFIPDQKYQQIEIYKKFCAGLHFVGEWHTHPQRYPLPSYIDINSMRDSYIKSNKELNYFLMIIIGNSKDFGNAWVSIHNGETYLKLYPIEI